MDMSVQNRSVLYEPVPVMVPEGVYPAKLMRVIRFENSFGERAGLVFEIQSGPHSGTELMQAARLTPSATGKLAALLRGLGGGLSPLDNLIGRRCMIVVKHGTTKTGKPFAGIVATLPE